MTNDLIAKRNDFTRRNCEQRNVVNGRDWGVLQPGSTGPALLLLPGTLGRADIFWNQIEALQDQTRILALSYPEEGGIKEWCADIAALLGMYSIESATVLGTSLGGYIAQYFAAIHPEKIDNLIAANTLSSVDLVASIPPYSADIDALSADDLVSGFSSGLKQWAAEEPHRADLVELLLTEVSGRITIGELRARLKALKFAPTLPKQTLDKSRIFTVESQDDRLIPEPLRAAVRAYLDPVRSIRFKQASHFPYVTEPKTYSKMILDICKPPA